MQFAAIFMMECAMGCPFDTYSLHPKKTSHPITKLPEEGRNMEKKMQMEEDLVRSAQAVQLNEMILDLLLIP